MRIPLLYLTRHERLSADTPREVYLLVSLGVLAVTSF